MANLQKIKENAKRIIDFIDRTTIYSNSVPSECYLAFNITTPKDDTQSFASFLFWSAYELLSETNIEGAGYISWILGSLVDYYSQPGSTPDNLNKEFVDIIGRFYETMIQLRLDIGYIYEDPEKHLNDTYKVPFGDKGTFTVIEMENWEIPQSSDTNFTLSIDAFRKAFRNQITKQILPEHYSIATIYYHYQERPDPFEPEEDCIGENPETTTSGSNSPIDWDGKSIEITLCGSNGERPYVENVGDDDSLESFKKTVNKLLSDKGQGFYTYDDSNGIKYYSYWLINKSTYGENWQIAPSDFTDWLFNDDGFGNQIKADGVASRRDVFTNWELDGYKGVKP